MMHHIGIIGTAGRDKTKPMTRALWDWMVAHAIVTIPAGQHLISGGAAWADHLAVQLFLMGHAEKLTIHMPSTFSKTGYIGPQMHSSAGAVNYYHERFTQQIGVSSIEQLVMAIDQGAACTHQAPVHGYSGMFARNKLIAQDSEGLIAYTFGEGDAPADGGTKNTWDQCNADPKLHVQLPFLY